MLVPDTGSAATTYTDHSVQANTTYTYRIKAINEHGVSERSRWFHIDTPVAPEPTPKASQSKSAYIDAHNARERALDQLLAQTDPSSPGGAANEDGDESKDGKSVGSPQGKAITPRATVNICDRTQEVQDAIINKTGAVARPSQTRNSPASKTCTSAATAVPPSSPMISRGSPVSSSCISATRSS